MLIGTIMKLVFKMLFLALSNVNINFNAWEPILRKYTIAKAIPITRRVEQINKHEFVKLALNKASNIFVVHMIALKAPVLMIIIYPMRKLLLVS